MRTGPAPTAPHGTVSAYKRHLRNGETPCEECKAAWAAYHRSLRARTALVILFVVVLLFSSCGQRAAIQETPASPVPPRACPKGSTVVVVGDSITVATSTQLTAALNSKGYTPAINAHSGRTLLRAIEPVAGYNEFHNLRRCWVVALGTNDIVHLPASQWQSDINTVTSYIPKNEPSWWVRVATAHGDEFNALVPYPLINWKPMASEVPDGTHPNEAGTQTWVALVMNALLSTPTT